MGVAILLALLFGVPFGLISGFRTRSSRGYDSLVDNPVAVAMIGNTGVSVILLFLVDSLVFWQARPSMSFQGLVPLIFFNLLVVAIVAVVWDLICQGISASELAWVALIVFGFIWVIGYNSGHDAYRASHIVSVSVEPNDALPASSTAHMVVVSSAIATSKAQQAMSTGIAGQRNYNTYLNLGPATLQMVDGRMFYVFPLEFDGAGNKARLHAVMPGYIMVSAEDPNAEPIEHYDGQYTMAVGLGAGQGAEPDRWAYDHGYKNVIDDPTLELNDQGQPFYTEAIMTPHLGWTFYAPSKVLLINAHTGAIKEYGLGNVPSWVDRVYGTDTASQIAGWYGQYSHAGFQGVGSSNANRFQVSGEPVLVYTGDEHPEWRMLLTSYNKDSSVSKIVIMDAHSGAMRIYTPREPMATEGPLVGNNGTFVKPSGQGASNVFANHYVPTGLTLHVIYGHLTWMVTYESGGSNSSFEGVGFVDAYHATPSNAVFGNSKSAALQNYLTQLASEGTSNGNTPGQGGDTQTFTGKIAVIGWDINGGQKFWYITLAGDPSHVYVGTTSSVGPALVMAQPGDSVTIRVLVVGIQEPSRTMQFFSDARVPLKAAGS
jgi:hypothetical protein